MRKTKEQKGITLIALAITIIVLLILAGVVLYTLTGNGSIIDNSNNAVQQYNESAYDDQNVINAVENMFERHFGQQGNVDTQASTLQAQYGDLVTTQDTINQDLFTFTTQEPSVGLVRHTASGTEGVVSRGDTPAAQKGTATITGINWNYFKTTNPDDFEVSSQYFPGSNGNSEPYAGSTSYTLTIKTEAKKTEIENTLKKLVIPYEVEKDGKIYVVTAISGELTKGDIGFIVPEGSGNKVTSFVEGSNVYHEQVTSSNDTSYLIIPNTVTTIGNLNFLPRDYILFTSSSQVTEFPQSILKDCKYLSHISLPDGLTEIGSYAFANCELLTTITIPDSITKIGYHAFYKCNSLEAVTYKGVTYRKIEELKSALTSNGVTEKSSFEYINLEEDN